jgi:hypothetical protein
MGGVTNPLDAAARPTARAGKAIAILQSSYLPWKGYFDLMARVDEFVLYDSVQYTRRDWRNRNRIKTPMGLCWLSVPVLSKGQYNAPICDMRVADGRWALRHWQTIRHAYARAPYFAEYAGPLEALYRTLDTPWLSEINAAFLRLLCAFLGIQTRITSCADYGVAPELDATQRLLSLCEQAGASMYISGPSARDYIRDDVFANAGIGIGYMDYAGYSPYPQLHGSFEHHVSVIDLLFQTGPNANRHMQCASRTE